MKTHILIFTILICQLVSCKSHKDVSRSSVNQTRVESLVSTNDSVKTHRETTASATAAKQDNSFTYEIEKKFAPDSNVVSIIERYIILSSRLDFASQFDEIKRDEFKYNSATQLTDTTSMVTSEVVKETKDSRPLQGIEIFYAITAGFLVVGIIIVIALKLF